MTIKSYRNIAAFISLVLLLLLSGCAGPGMNMSVVPETEVSQAPAAGKARVVFMRDTFVGSAIQSSVFDVTNEQPVLVGIVANKTKVSYDVDPGKHLFMVVGESADFMSADLQARKTYYALVTPRPGLWKARFSLKPIHAADLNTDKFNDWYRDCQWVTNNAASENWAMSNMGSIQAKRQKYYAKWIAKNPNDQPRLLPQDGL